MATKSTIKKNTTNKGKAATRVDATKVKTSSKAKAPAKKKTAAKRKTSSKSAKVTTIRAHVDIGWGNRLFIRGNGAGLKWEIGQEMDWSDGNWTWSTANANGEGIEFKFLINDEVWSEGGNLVISSGESYTTTPEF